MHISLVILARLLFANDGNLSLFTAVVLLAGEVLHKEESSCQFTRQWFRGRAVGGTDEPFEGI